MLPWSRTNTDLDALLLALQHVQEESLDTDISMGSNIRVIFLSKAILHVEQAIEILLNTVSSLVRFGRVGQYIVAACDEDAQVTCLSLNLPCYDVREVSAPSFCLGLITRGYNIHLVQFGNS